MTGGGSGGGGTQSSTTSTVQELSPEQRELLGLVLPAARDFSENPPQFFPFSRIAGTNPLIGEAQRRTLDAAGGVAGGASQAQDFSNFSMGAGLFPESNPSLQAAFKSAIRPIERSFSQSVLPNIRSDAAKAGQFGSSRQGIAEGLAAQSLFETEQDLIADIANEQFGNTLEAGTRALALAPQTAQLQFAGPQAIGAVGAQRQAEDQRFLNEDVARFSFDQTINFQVAQAIAQLAFGFPGGSTLSSSTGPAPRGPSTFNQVLGTGSQLGSLALMLQLFSRGL